MRSRMQVQNARAHVFYNRAFFRRSEYPTRSGLFSSTDPLVEWKITSPRHCPLSLRGNVNFDVALQFADAPIWMCVDANPLYAPQIG
jgi:hypothetical protein